MSSGASAGAESVLSQSSVTCPPSFMRTHSRR